MYRTALGWRGESHQVKLRAIIVDIALGLAVASIPLLFFPFILSISLEGSTFFYHLIFTLTLIIPALFVVFTFCFLHTDQHDRPKSLVRSSPLSRKSSLITINPDPFLQQESLWHGFCGVIFGTTFFHIFAILFGAPFVE